MNETDKTYWQTLKQLEDDGCLRALPEMVHSGKWAIVGGKRLLNLSSNDYLGLASDTDLQGSFLAGLSGEEALLSSSSSRLLTGNFAVHRELETMIAERYGAEAALTFGSGYHMNAGILPAVTDSNTLILADKLVHASLIDGIRLSAARCIRYRHGDISQLELLLQKYHAVFPRIIIVTESIFSMDGDLSPLMRLAELKRKFLQTMLYVDEAHAVGVRGEHGLGVAEEQDCIKDIDFLCGTFGKALASVGAFVVCSKVMRDYLINKMRTFIFTTALPPANVSWTKYVWSRMDDWADRRAHLRDLSVRLKQILKEAGCHDDSQSHVLPMVIGKSSEAVRVAEKLQAGGFYVLPVRPPTVPAGTARIRFSLSAGITMNDLEGLQCLLQDKKE